MAIRMKGHRRTDCQPRVLGLMVSESPSPDILRSFASGSQEHALRARRG